MSQHGKTTWDNARKAGWVLGPNGELYHPSRLPAGQREQPVGLEGQKPAKERRPGGLGGSGAGGARRRIAPVHGLAPVLLITLIRLGPRRIDTGNLETGFKTLQDEVAASLGVDDQDSRIEFEYGQAVSQIHGSVVVIRKFK